jgi:hypothetical protein
MGKNYCIKWTVVDKLLYLEYINIHFVLINEINKILHDTDRKLN